MKNKNKNKQNKQNKQEQTDMIAPEALGAGK